MQAYRNGVRVGELRDAQKFAEKLRNLSQDGSKRFGESWSYDVEADIKAYIDIARKVSIESTLSNAA